MKKVNRGMLEEKSQLSGLLKKYPQGVLWLRLRNFNKLDSVNLVGILDIPEGNPRDDLDFEKTRAYVNRVDVTSGIFPVKIINKLKTNAGGVSINFFLQIAQEIADLMQRKVKITHQYGSGDQSQAEFDNYEFIPTRREKDMKKILIIGAGHVVGYHLGAIRRMWPLAEVSVTDINSSKASNPDLTKFHARFVPDSGRRAEMQGADLVVICVPCEEHFVVAKEALEDGKIVLLEKPPTKTVAEFEELVTLSKSVPGAKLICAFHAAHDLTINQFTAEMQDGVHPKYGKLVGIRAEFSDPYVENGLVIKSMGGSWEDSSSNALSVVARFVDLSQFDLKSALITNDVPATDGCKCLDSKSRVMYEFSSGKAEIFTDWTTGRNRKVAELTLQDDAGKETKFLLHHSKQKILIESGGGDEEEYLIYADCDNGQTRLDNHYDGVYGDLQLMIANQTDNTDLGLQITKLWIGAYEMANIKG